MTRKIEHDILTLPKDKFVKKLPRVGFELASSGFRFAALPIELSSQQGLEVSSYSI